MKNILSIITLAVIVIISPSATCEAQILKGLGKKLEKKIEERLERKADRNVDKVLDKADQKTDQPLEGALSGTKAGSDDKKPVAKPAKSNLKFEEIESRPDQTLLLVGNNCHDFSWFKKGTLLEYEIFDEKGKLEAVSKMEVRNLRNEGSATVAEVEASLKAPKLNDVSYQMNYICDGDKFYIDMGAMMQAMMKNNPELHQQDKAVLKALDNTKFDFDKGFASFPKKMYPGMKLDDLAFSIKTGVAGAEMAVNATISDRQVLAKEKVTTKAGTFECLKIRSVTSTSMKVMGFNKNMPQSIEYLWIAPAVGTVKQETTQVNGKVTSSTQLKTYKM